MFSERQGKTRSRSCVWQKQRNSETQTHKITNEENEMGLLTIVAGPNKHTFCCIQIFKYSKNINWLMIKLSRNGCISVVHELESKEGKTATHSTIPHHQNIITLDSSSLEYQVADGTFAQVPGTRKGDDMLSSQQCKPRRASEMLIVHDGRKRILVHGAPSIHCCSEKYIWTRQRK